MQRVRAISTSGRNPSLSRPSFTRYSNGLPPLSLPPLATTSSGPNSPASRSSSPSISPTASRNRRISLLSPLPTTPILSHDKLLQPPDLTGQVSLSGMNFCERGGFGVVWSTTWHSKSADKKVAVKCILPRGRDREDQKIRLNKRLRREIQVWKRLYHHNVVPLLGVLMDDGLTSLGMVSPWMNNGNLVAFLHKNAISTSARLQLMCGVVEGLLYLHSKGIIHGDLTGANVLINDNQEGCLVDFGLSSIRAEFEGTSYWSSSVGGAIRWRAPELMPGGNEEPAPVLTEKCDVYSFGCIMLQTFSGLIPYHDIKNDIRVVLMKYRGIQSIRPTHPVIDDHLWQFIVECWCSAPAARPSVYQLGHRLREFTKQFL